MSSLQHSRVAIVGRPNVGKSTLFNKLTRTRKAVVRDERGVTRDIQIEPAEWWGHKFDVVDTGGITDDRAGFSPLIREQVVNALTRMDLLILVMDGRTGVVPEDRDIIRVAKESGKPFIIAVNKLDSERDVEVALGEFYEFSAEVLPVAFERDFNTDKLVEWVISELKTKEHTQREGVRLAIVGKPNVGKSSLFNRLLGERRTLVSDVAGTTVDAVEAEFQYNGKPYILVDTAGLRRQSRRKDGVEFLSAIKSEEAVNRCDIALLVIDAVEGPSVQDAKILEHCLHRHRGVIVVANKVDLAKGANSQYREWFRDRIAREFHFFRDVRVAFVSAKTGVGLNELFREIDDIYEKLHLRITTSKLNKFFFETIRQAPAPVYATVNVKFYYLVQTHQVPPSFIAFANHPDGVTPSYRRFLSNRIQAEFGLKGIPIRIFVMASGGRSLSRRRNEEAEPTASVENFDDLENLDQIEMPSEEVLEQLESEYDLGGME